MKDDIIVAGGGVIGLTIAWELVKEGRSVTVVDQYSPGQEASWAGAGMIPPGDREAGPAAHALARYSSEIWPALSAELREQTGIDNGYHHCGGIHVELNSLPVGLTAAPPLQQLQQSWQQLGVQAEIATGTSLRSMEPHLSPAIAEALSLPELAQVRNPRHLKALQAACAQKGVKFLSGHSIYEWKQRENRIVSAITPQGELSADLFIVATGAWTSQVLRSLIPSVKIRPVRGQIVMLSTASRPLHRVIECGPRYLVPRTDGRILVGATEELTGFQKENTASAVRMLLEFAETLVPTLAQARIEKTWAGLRPQALRGLPLISQSMHYENLFVAAGHFRAGLSNSPGTARMICDLVQQRISTIDVQPFQID